ncbi:hypothetical protein CDEST_03063 [Colletotrichum destructivum]|uniref:Uncharacterized protein n=1 Tax=Colletotrichum destructivum TaxID=34406 RepID=A0AAX4I3W2_9PEZI|nr:hypothetical protein CDEST_03063 [Colletotrichum destructivum]
MADHRAASALAGEGVGQQQQQQYHEHQHQRPQQPGKESGSGDSRPSFTGYWREEQVNERAGRVQFVNEGPPPPPRQLQHQPSVSSSSLSPSSAMEPGDTAAEGDQERQGSCESSMVSYLTFFQFLFFFILPCCHRCHVVAFVPSIGPSRPSPS